MKLLITSWRSFVALEFIRIFKDHEIYIAESQEECICKYSRYVRNIFLTSSPRFCFNDYKKEILNIVQEHSIDLIIPTCEDIFYISQFKDEIIRFWTDIWCDSFQKLKKIHSKFEIIEMVKWLEIHTPKTLEFSSKEILKDFIDMNPIFQYVIKPKYSRFAQNISSNMIAKSLPVEDLNIDLSNNSYILQEYIEWIPLCSYSSFYHGKLVSHTCYSVLLSYKNGSATFFQTCTSAIILNFVTNFAKKYNFHWHISFDFIKKNNGDFFLIECNPRITSGIHLLKNENAFKETVEKTLLKNSISPFILTKKKKAWFFFVNLLFAYKFSNMAVWFQSLFTDIVFDLHDIKPFFYQLRLIQYYKKISKEKYISLSEVTTYDIEYNWCNES